MNPKKIIRFVFLLALITYLLNYSITCILAARQRTRKPRVTGTKTAAPKGVISKVRFRADHLGLLLNFSNFDNLQSGHYELLYETNGVTQGAGGTIILGDTSTKELLFATCSGAVCTFHEGITNARLSIVSVLKDGTTVLKPYRIKV